MKALVGTALLALAIGSVAMPAVLFAQQKTAKECREEWRANRDANKAAGVKEKDYVAKCREGGAAAAPTTPPARKAATPTPTPATGAAKTAKECRDEWRTNKDANKAAGVKEKDYVAKCREGGAAPAPKSAAPAPATPPPTTAAPAPAPAAPAPTGTAPARPAAPSPAPAAAAPTGANQYSTEAQAKVRCPSDAVVWVNLHSKIYHFSGYRNYGATKEGAYMCEKDAVAQSFNAAKNEKHP